MEQAIRLLDVRLRIRCDEPGLVEPFLAVFSPLRERGGGVEPARDVLITVDASGGLFIVEGTEVRLASEPVRQAHVYNLLYRTLVRSLGGVYLLHAAVLAEGDRAWILAGPSGAGKTSLARALARRGFALLGDDVAPLSIEDGRVHAFPRRLGLLPGEASAEELREAVAVGGKAFVAPDRAVDRPGGTEPRTPAAVVVVSPYDDPHGDTVPLRVGLAGGARGGRLLERLRGIDGVELEVAADSPGLTTVRLRLRGSRAFSSVDRELDEADSAVVFHVREYGSRKHYGAQPELTRIPAREAAVWLLRETLNRGRRSGLMRRHGGSVVACLFELSGLIGGVPCYRLHPAEIEATADLLARRMRAGRR